MRRFLKVQPLFTMQQSHQQVIVMLEPAFCSGNLRVISLLCDMLRSIYKPFPVPSTTQPAELPKEVHVSPSRSYTLPRHSGLCPSAVLEASRACYSVEWYRNAHASSFMSLAIAGQHTARLHDRHMCIHKEMFVLFCRRCMPRCMRS